MHENLIENDGQEKTNSASAVKWFILGAIITCAIWLGIYFGALQCDDDCDSSSTSYNASDYLSADDYYMTQPVHPFTVNDNMRLDRLGSPVLSPDGRAVLFTRRQARLPDSETSTTTIHLIKLNDNETHWLNTTATPVQLTRPEWGIADSAPYWSADGSIIFFLSNRPSDGSQQVFYFEYRPNKLPASGSYWTPIQLTYFPLDVDNFMISPTDDLMVFSTQIYPGLNISASAQKKKDIAASGINALEFDKLFVRHWDTWRDGTRNTPFAMPLTINGGKATVNDSDPLSLMFGVDADAPTKPYGGIEEWSFSPDGRSFVFTRRHDETSEVAWSTNLDLFLVEFTQVTNPVKAKEPRCLTCDNIATDTQPRFSPDGRSIAYLAMAVPQYESDRLRIRILDVETGDINGLTESWLWSINDVTWAPDGKSVWAELLEDGDGRVYNIDLSGNRVPILTDGGSMGVNPTPDGTEFLYAYNSWTEPVSLRVATVDGSVSSQLTTYNSVVLEKCKTSPGKKFRFTGAHGDQVSAWVWEPVDRQDGQLYPVAYLIHGGPQGAWEQGWSYRWNPQVYAGAGFAVAAVNFHGSSGYGQPFTDSIQGDYGGAPFEDLMTGIDMITLNYPYMNASSVAALGASYGGFMINWIAGQVPANNRFKVLVCHDGMFDIRDFYYSTEELWFPEHDMMGVPWLNASNYERWNPATDSLVAQWHLPQLIIHGGLDFRITEAQGLAAFTALQRRGIPSKLLYFPKENHWVLNSRNSIKWHEVVLDWISQYTK